MKTIQSGSSVGSSVRHFSFVAALVALALPPTAPAGPLVLEEKTAIPAPDPASSWPESIAIDGDWLIVTSSKDLVTVEKDYSAWLYQRQSDRSWRLVRRLLQQITADTGAELSIRVAMRGGVAALVHEQGNQGIVTWIFERSGNDWVSVPSPIDSDGMDIEINDGTIVTTSGHCSYMSNAYRKGANGAWQLVRVTDPEPSECDTQFDFGDVDVSGNAIIVTSVGDATKRNAIRIFEGPFGTVPTVTRLVPEREDLVTAGPVAIDLPSAVVGGFNVRLFAYTREATGVWNLSGKLQRPDDLTLLGSGGHVKMRGGLALSAAPVDRSVAVFQRNTDGTFSYAAKLVPSDRGIEWYGGSPAISERQVAVGGDRRVHVYDLPADLSQPATVQDTFEDGNASTWTPIAGSAFSVISTSTSKVLRQSSDAGNAAAFLDDTDWQNQAVEADIKPTAFASGTGERWFGLATRYIDANNFYYVTLRGRNLVQLKKKANGSVSMLASAPLPITLNSTYRVRLEAIGTRVRAYVNDALLLDVRDTSLKHGRAGVYMYKTKADYDNIVVSANPRTTLARLAFEIEEDTPILEQLGTWLRTPVEGNTKIIYVQPSTTGDARAITGIDTDDQVVQASIRPTSLPSGGSNWFGVVSRYRDSGNFYYVTLRSTNVVSLRKLVNGAIVELDRAPLSVATNNWYRVRMDALGDQLRVYVNGQLKLEATDSTHATGRYGLATYRAAADFDEVVVAQP